MAPGPTNGTPTTGAHSPVPLPPTPCTALKMDSSKAMLGLPEAAANDPTAPSTPSASNQRDAAKTSPKSNIFPKRVIRPSKIPYSLWTWHPCKWWPRKRNVPRHCHSRWKSAHDPDAYFSKQQRGASNAGNGHRFTARGGPEGYLSKYRL